MHFKLHITSNMGSSVILN